MCRQPSDVGPRADSARTSASAASGAPGGSAGVCQSRANVRSVALTFFMVADFPAGAQAFEQYESLVLRLLPRHGGRLELRLRTVDALTEVHTVSLLSQAGYESYVADEERMSHGWLLDGVQLEQRRLQVQDVQP